MSDDPATPETPTPQTAEQAAYAQYAADQQQAAEFAKAFLAQIPKGGYAYPFEVRFEPSASPMVCNSGISSRALMASHIAAGIMAGSFSHSAIETVEDMQAQAESPSGSIAIGSVSKLAVRLADEILQLTEPEHEQVGH